MAKKTTDNKARRLQILDEEIANALQIFGQELVELMQKNLIGDKYDFTPLSTKPPPKKSPGGYAYRKKRDGYGDKPILVRTGSSLSGITFRYKKKGNRHKLDIISKVYNAHAKGGGNNDLPVRDAIGSSISPMPGARSLFDRLHDQIGMNYVERIRQEGLV